MFSQVCFENNAFSHVLYIYTSMYMAIWHTLFGTPLTFYFFKVVSSFTQAYMQLSFLQCEINRAQKKCWPKYKIHWSENAKKFPNLFLFCKQKTLKLFNPYLLETHAKLPNLFGIQSIAIPTHAAYYFKFTKSKNKFLCKMLDKQ